MYFWLDEHRLLSAWEPPAGMLPIDKLQFHIKPPLVTELHRRLRDWGDTGLSPGEIVPDRIWGDEQGALAFRFAGSTFPKPLTHVGLARELAAWLVMLDQWVETFVVVARARAVWPAAELAGALTFMTPVFLPPALQLSDPARWERMAVALAGAVGDIPR